jgi:hypothetical protein
LHTVEVPIYKDDFAHGSNAYPPSRKLYPPSRLSVSVDINGFYPKSGASEGAENQLTQLVTLALVIIHIFLPPSVFLVHRVDDKPMYLKTGLQSPYLQTF